MKDSVIFGTGNSRYLKSVQDFKTLYPTYDDFAAALVAGTLPVDFNGINPAGFQQIGDALSKETLLKDDTAALYGLEDTAVPDDVFALLFPKAKIEAGTYTGKGAVGSNRKSNLVFSFTPKIVIITVNNNSSDRNGVFGIFVWGNPLVWSYGLRANGILSVTYTEKKMSWYAHQGLDTNGNSITATARMQLNDSATTYYYVAIG